MIASARVARAVFPPEQVAEVKALACELSATHGLPLSIALIVLMFVHVFYALKY